MMKSIVEEASTLEKAITQAWKRAGNPKKFTVTIFQEAEKNFFGMTTLPAKIGFVFEEAEQTQKTPKKVHEKPQPVVQHTQQKQKQNTPIAQPSIQKEVSIPSDTTLEKKDNNRFWTEPMIHAAEKWLKIILQTIAKDAISFSIKPSRYHLKIQFSQPIFDDAKKEKTFFRSCALLMMQAQRALFKKSFKHHKIILMSN